MPTCRCFPSLTLIITLFLMMGCRVRAPIHVWEPPQLESAVGSTIAISSVRGRKEIADPLREKMLALAPRDPGRRVTILDPAKFNLDPVIQLTSGSDEPNDLAAASVARRGGNTDFLLRGEIISSRSGPTTETDLDGPLAISWRLLSVRDDRHAGGSPVVVDVESAIKRYPDLAIVSDKAQVLTTAAVRDTYRLITPSISRDNVNLANSYFLPGSREVRRANLLAQSGRWGEAEQIWSQVADSHPMQVAAIHNLALAAAAAQDFSQSKMLIRKVIRRLPSPNAKQTLVWIELKQRDYHNAFGLPDPPEGWFVTQGE